MQLVVLQLAPLALPGIFRTKLVKAHAYHVMRVRSAAAQASLLSAAVALQERSLLVAPPRLRARPVPQASTAQLQA